MLSPIQKERFLKRFAAIESSFRIEGMDPAGDPIYEKAKRAVLAGELTPKQALDIVVQWNRSPRPKTPVVTA
jgi:hypothetical protein